MKRSSPLLWLCVLCAAALAALALLDPTGVYASYRASLAGDTPPIAAVFLAAQDGLYPWSRVPQADEPSVPVFSPADEPEPAEPVEPAEAAQPVVPEPEPEPEPDPEPEFIPVELSYFDDAVFIGDSHIEGFYEYARVPNATYYWKRGLMVWDVLDNAFIPADGKKLTVPEALEQQSFGKLYVMLGINEIGDADTEGWAAQYRAVLDTFCALQPDALIYVHAIFHTTQEASDTTIYNNAVINDRNAAIERLCAENDRLIFIDANVVFDNEEGVLPEELSGDGVHVMAPYYALWRDYLLQFGKAGY